MIPRAANPDASISMQSPAFWQRLKSGVEVAVTPPRPDILLGIRDGFLRFFHDGLAHPLPVAVVGQPGADELGGLLLSDEDVLATAFGRARALRERLGSAYHFYATSEAGLHTVEVDGQLRTFVRNWVALVGPDGVESCGSSGSLELPEHIVASLDRTGSDAASGRAASGRAATGFTIPGRRRSGGIISSLTGGLETRRSAVAVSTLHAVSSMLYGVIETRAVRRR